MTSLGNVDLGLSLGAVSDATGARLTANLKDAAKAKGASQDFEAMFLNSMFQQMFTGIDGDGPFGGTGALKVWRSFLTDQYAKSFAKAGGVGIATQVYQELLKHQGAATQ